MAKTYLTQRDFFKRRNEYDRAGAVIGSYTATDVVRSMAHTIAGLSTTERGPSSVATQLDTLYIYYAEWSEGRKCLLNVLSGVGNLGNMSSKCG